MTRIINFGSLNIDYVYKVPHFIRPGETMSSLERCIYAGGKGLNQTVALKRAGADVYHAGSVGADDGKVLLDVLRADGIPLDYVAEKPMPSGHTIIQVDTNGQNCIILFGGANQSFTREQVDQALNDFEAGDYLILQNETNLLEYIIPAAAERGIKPCFNVSPYDDCLLSLPLNRCAYLLVNEIEGAGLAHVAPDALGPRELADRLRAEYPSSNIVLTLGKRGSALIPAEGEITTMGSYDVKAIDTTAAGDTFSGYLIAELAAGANPVRALQVGTAAAAIAVTRRGATPSIPYRDEVQTFVERHTARPILL
ncbi:MAG: ribokinase [Succinivibrionaceae bacterium]|nr:ribokinase [Succinivibrionaceae bacterium]